MRPAYWIPPVVWMGLIFWLSSDAGSAQRTGALLQPLLVWFWPTATPLQLQALHGLIRKIGHLAAYGVLAGLYYRALRWGRDWAPRRASACAFVLSLGWAVVDETHQSFLASRTGSAGDVLLDTAGALAALVIVRAGWRATAQRATTVLLWLALGGGALLLLIDALAGVSSGWRWLTVPGAALVLAVRHRWRGKA